MLNKRLIVCLDVRGGKLAKSIRFIDTKDIGDPVAKARQYYEDGVDELVFYDITASRENRDIMINFVEQVASQIFIPFSVGGGIRSVADATRLRNAGAEKVKPFADRRREFRRRYAGMDEDPEAIPETREFPREPLIPESPPPASPLKVACADWPFSADEARRRQTEAGECQWTIKFADGITLDMVLIPAGRFVMGSGDERPPTAVRINRAFWMGRFEITNEQWRRTFSVNIDSFFYTTKAAVPQLSDGGAIINTSSINGLRGNKKLIDYSATKGAILELTYSLAQSLSDRQIRVNCVAPGPVWTPLIPATMNAEKPAEFGQNVPFGRPAQPDEIAPSYVFFAATQLSSYYSGEVLAPIGGCLVAEPADLLFYPFPIGRRRGDAFLLQRFELPVAFSCLFQRLKSRSLAAFRGLAPGLGQQPALIPPEAHRR